MEKNRVIILGSGPTGLITAWKLLEKGLNVLIIEKNLNSLAELVCNEHGKTLDDASNTQAGTGPAKLRELNIADMQYYGQDIAERNGIGFNETYPYP